MFERLYDVDDGFDYRVAKDSKGRPNGYVWMTSAMRAAYEQFGDVIYLDAMAKEQNSIAWPYIGPTMLDGSNKIAVACESVTNHRSNRYFR